MDKFGIDGHKLHLHPGRVEAWLSGRGIYPIYAEIALARACNHRCVFCSMDFVGYAPLFLDDGVLRARLTELRRLGLKSVMYAGEGEPLLNRQAARIIRHSRRVGLDVALTTNGVLLRPDLCRRILADLSWVKVSINAGTAATYARVHRAKPADFDAVLSNLAYAARYKKSRGLKTALGMQMVLLPENRREVLALARRAKAAGMDYLVVKPYSQHPLSRTRRFQDIRYERDYALAERLERLNDGRFHVVFRRETMRRWDEKAKGYGRCLGLPFWTYIDAAGDVWGCSRFLGDKDFLYGNILKSGFRAIWEGRARRRSLRREVELRRCNFNCRLDEINRYLWLLKHPPEHVNFI
ncbi:MAG: radical SAM protein [Elusimicrobia bacterium]|nr:radical SAM protein [Elusimicrobiota bacterium]